MAKLLEINHLCVDYPLAQGWGAIFSSKKTQTLRAVNDVSFIIKKGDALGLVGESGCGKSTLGRAILQLEHVNRGYIKFDNQKLADLSSKEVLGYRRRAQMIFQEPVGALNPRLTVRQALLEVVKVHNLRDSSQQAGYVEQIASEVGFPADLLDRKPSSLSGGQCQRASIARALAVGAEFLIADEPVSALDVSVQAQIMNLLKHLRSKRNMTMLFISHDLSVVRQLCDRIAVMYLGSIVENGPVEEVFSNPRHPYTQALVASIPSLESDNQNLPPVAAGEPPSPANPPSGCPFHPRCPHVFEPCVEPPFPRARVIDNVNVCCHLY